MQKKGYARIIHPANIIIPFKPIFILLCQKHKSGHFVINNITMNLFKQPFFFPWIFALKPNNQVHFEATKFAYFKITAHSPRLL